MAERSEERKEARESYARQDASRHVTDLQAWPTIRPDSSNLRVKPDAFCPVQNYEHIRSDDSQARTSLRHTAPPA